MLDSKREAEIQSKSSNQNKVCFLLYEVIAIFSSSVSSFRPLHDSTAFQKITVALSVTELFIKFNTRHDSYLLCSMNHLVSLTFFFHTDIVIVLCSTYRLNDGNFSNLDLLSYS